MYLLTIGGTNFNVGVSFKWSPNPSQKESPLDVVIEKNLVLKAPTTFAAVIPDRQLDEHTFCICTDSWLHSTGSSLNFKE